MSNTKSGSGMKSRIGFMAAIACALSAGLGYVRIPTDKMYSRQRKRGGGKGGTRRINSPRYKAWKKAFGGLAVTPYSE